MFTEGVAVVGTVVVKTDRPLLVAALIGVAVIPLLVATSRVLVDLLDVGVLVVVVWLVIGPLSRRVLLATTLWVMIVPRGVEAVATPLLGPAIPPLLSTKPCSLLVELLAALAFEADVIVKAIFESRDITH